MFPNCIIFSQIHLVQTHNFHRVLCYPHLPLVYHNFYWTFCIMLEIITTFNLGLNTNLNAGIIQVLEIYSLLLIHSITKEICVIPFQYNCFEFVRNNCFSLILTIVLKWYHTYLLRNVMYQNKAIIFQHLYYPSIRVGV